MAKMYEYTITIEDQFMTGNAPEVVTNQLQYILQRLGIDQYTLVVDELPLVSEDEPFEPEAREGWDYGTGEDHGEEPF